MGTPDTGPYVARDCDEDTAGPRQTIVPYWFPRVTVGVDAVRKLGGFNCGLSLAYTRATMINWVPPVWTDVGPSGGTPTNAPFRPLHGSWSGVTGQRSTGQASVYRRDDQSLWKNFIDGPAPGVVAAVFFTHGPVPTANITAWRICRIFEYLPAACGIYGAIQAIESL